MDEWIVMPNHVHAIIVITRGGRGDRPVAPTDGQSQRPRGPAAKSMPALIAGFKCAVTRDVNAMRGTPGIPLWQRNYYEHIVRNEDELRKIRKYVADNPLQWELDRENPEARGGSFHRPEEVPQAASPDEIETILGGVRP